MTTQSPLPPRRVPAKLVRALILLAVAAGLAWVTSLAPGIFIIFVITPLFFGLSLGIPLVRRWLMTGTVRPPIRIERHPIERS